MRQERKPGRTKWWKNYQLSVQLSNHKTIRASRDNFKSYPGRSGAMIGDETEWTILQLRDEFYLSLVEIFGFSLVE